MAGVQDTYKTLRDMNKRQVLTQLLMLGLIVTSALMIWKVRLGEMRGGGRERVSWACTRGLEGNEMRSATCDGANSRGQGDRT